jgi:PAS domain S-box-containing protein
MVSELRVLFIEDSADDVWLMTRELEQAGFTVISQRVDSAQALEASLQHPWDIVISDYRMPNISAYKALARVHQTNPNTPVIVVSGAISAEAAIELLHAGARDYITKDQLTRLAPSIQRSLQELALQHDRQQAITALQESEKLWLLALESSGDSVWDWDLTRNRLTFSRGWKSILGYAEDEISNYPSEWLGRIYDEDLPYFCTAIEQYLLGQIAVHNVEYRIHNKTNTLCWVLSRGGIVARDPDGTPLRMVGTFSDITERKRSEGERLLFEQKLQQAQKMQALGTLAGGIAHDFNNILTAIMGYTSLLELEVSTQPDTLEIVLEVSHASQRAKQLVQQILNFSRPQEENFSVVHVQGILNEVLQLVRVVLPAQIKITTHIEKSASPVLANANQLHQIIMNLITNAIAAIEGKPGQIEISLVVVDQHDVSALLATEVPAGNYVELRVSDTGHGMDAATRERIFEPFFTTRAPGQGTGLGLSVVHSLVLSHHGFISVSSELQQGSTFRIFLPTTATTAGQAATAGTDTSQGAGQHILYVDDEPALCRLVVRMLERLGYQASTQSNGADAIEQMRNNGQIYSIAILDLTMPGMNGLDLAREILQIRPDLPIVLTTGSLSATTFEKIQALGIKSLLKKPFTNVELARTIADIVDPSERS